jgi:hypothetical protein
LFSGLWNGNCRPRARFCFGHSFYVSSSDLL